MTTPTAVASPTATANPIGERLPMSPARAIYEVARKEVLQHIRTKRLLIIAPIFLLALVFVTIVFPLVVLEESAFDELAESVDGVPNFVMLFFFSGFFFLSGYFYVQLVPILLTADAVCSEWSNRTIFLLLSKPLSRTSFVLGKYLGSVATVALVLFPLLTLDFLLLQVLLPGSSDGEHVLRFFGALGILLLGAMAYAALALLMGTLTRSTVVANLLAIMLWIIVLPLLSQLGMIIALAQEGEGAFEDPPTWSQYLSPGSAMTTAGDVLVDFPAGEDDLGSIARLAGFSGALDVGWAVLALVLHIAVFLGLSLLVVRRRDFE